VLVNESRRRTDIRIHNNRQTTTQVFNHFYAEPGLRYPDWLTLRGRHVHIEVGRKYKEPNVSYQSVDRPKLLRHLGEIAVEQTKTPLVDNNDIATSSVPPQVIGE
jgi:hypothetical protein